MSWVYVLRRLTSANSEDSPLLRDVDDHQPFRVSTITICLLSYREPADINDCADRINITCRDACSGGVHRS